MATATKTRKPASKKAAPSKRGPRKTPMARPQAAPIKVTEVTDEDLEAVVAEHSPETPRGALRYFAPEQIGGSVPARRKPASNLPEPQAMAHAFAPNGWTVVSTGGTAIRSFSSRQEAEIVADVEARCEQAVFYVTRRGRRVYEATGKRNLPTALPRIAPGPAPEAGETSKPKGTSKTRTPRAPKAELASVPGAILYYTYKPQAGQILRLHPNGLIETRPEGGGEWRKMRVAPDAAAVAATINGNEKGRTKIDAPEGEPAEVK